MEVCGEGAKCADSLHQGTEVALGVGVDWDEELQLAGASDGRIVELDYLSKPSILRVLRAGICGPQLIVSDDLKVGTIREESAVPILAGQSLGARHKSREILVRVRLPEITWVLGTVFRPIDSPPR